MKNTNLKVTISALLVSLMIVGCGESSKENQKSSLSHSGKDKVAEVSGSLVISNISPEQIKATGNSDKLEDYTLLTPEIVKGMEEKINEVKFEDMFITFSNFNSTIKASLMKNNIVEDKEFYKDTAHKFAKMIQFYDIKFKEKMADPFFLQNSELVNKEIANFALVINQFVRWSSFFINENNINLLGDLYSKESFSNDSTLIHFTLLPNDQELLWWNTFYKDKYGEEIPVDLLIQKNQYSSTDYNNEVLQYWINYKPLELDSTNTIDTKLIDTRKSLEKENHENKIIKEELKALEKAKEKGDNINETEKIIEVVPPTIELKTTNINN